MKRNIMWYMTKASGVLAMNFFPLFYGIWYQVFEIKFLQKCFFDEFFFYKRANRTYVCWESVRDHSQSTYEPKWVGRGQEIRTI